MHVVLSLADQDSTEGIEELDEDIAVTQSQVNFSCPLTQVNHSGCLDAISIGKLCYSKQPACCVLSAFKVEMVNPMKNKKCSHHYDEEAILSLIKTKHSQKKKCR